MSDSNYVDHAIDLFKKALVAQVDPTSIAAVIIEPVQGEGGFIQAPNEYLRKLRALCAEHGILFVADEVQSGFCRTGKMFSIDHSGVQPDMLLTAKSIASGMPVAAVTGKAEIMDAPHVGGLGSTYGGNPVACASAIATIDYMLEHDLASRANEIGKITNDYFQKWKGRREIIGDTRCTGAMCAIEFVNNRKTKEPNKLSPARVVEEGYQRGLIMIRAGLYSSCVRTLAPLTITDEQLHEAMSALGEAVAIADAEHAAA